ncbi:MAG: SPASM domain-containing protein [Bacteroidaceae bacterium]|nr:SPASM domain-containing protein [Bacteroidaceae bacterium]
MITRCYLEITNICNLNCFFCPKTDRAKRRLTLEEFETLTNRLQGKIKFLYFHLMGEPLLHPQLPQFIEIARRKGFIPVLTTNGTLLAKAYDIIDALPHKIQISLHSHEGNSREDAEEYIREVMKFSIEAVARGIVIVLRFWNQGGSENNNERLIQLISEYAPQPWSERYYGWRLQENLYIEFDKIFEWPDSESDEYACEESFCYALRNQIGVLVDGTVVPCCLDHEGEIALGNLFEAELEDILESPRARAIYDGFTRHNAVEPLCRRCGYAAVTKRFRKK